MPELPEVETMRRGVAPVVGRIIEDVRRGPSRLRAIEIAPTLAVFRRRASQRTITAVERIGKRVVLRLDSDERIVFEPRMTGLVLLADPPNLTHLRFEVRLAPQSQRGPANPSNILFWDQRGLGKVRLYAAEEFESRFALDRLGPDALGVSAQTLRERFAASRRAIKVALLDQRALAGVGNLYASEALHLAGIDPRRRCDKVTGDEWRRLALALGEVLELAIRYEGSTLSDGTYRNAFNQEGGYQNHHRVYDRRGELCPTCSRGAIERIVQAQRSTYFCRHCQGRKRR